MSASYSHRASVRKGLWELESATVMGVTIVIGFVIAYKKTGSFADAPKQKLLLETMSC